MYHSDYTDSSDYSLINAADSKAGVAGSAGFPGELPEHPTFEKPPYTNRGALITFPLVNRFLIDWFAFTIKGTDPQWAVVLIGLKPSLFTEVDHGKYGYCRHP